MVDALANYPELQFSYLRSIILARDPNYERERQLERERDGVTETKDSNQPSMAELLERSGNQTMASMLYIIFIDANPNRHEVYSKVTRDIYSIIMSI